MASDMSRELADPLLQSDNKTDKDGHILQRSPDNLEGKLDKTARKRRRKFFNKVLGVILVIGTQLTNVLGAEILQIEERGCVGANTSRINETSTSKICVKAFDSPYFSIWFNHSITGRSVTGSLRLVYQ